MSKQTAVEWLVNEIIGLDYELPGEKYYNETFKN